MIVLFVSIIAFASAFYSISTANASDDQFVTGFTDSLFFSYKMALGDWDTDSFGSVGMVIVWTMFLLCTIFNVIVLLNLLISIISDTFARVKENQENAAY